MYESPIEITTSEIISQISKKQDKEIFEAILKTGVNVNKEELLKALKYDRNQYNEGFADGVKDFADTFKKHISSFTGMFTDEEFMVSLQAVLRAVDFIKERLVGESND